MAIDKRGAQVIPLPERPKPADGRKALINEWFQRDYRRLQAYIKRLLPAELLTELSAEDVLQEVFTRLMARRDLIEIINPRAYIMIMARNCVIDCLRHHQRNRSLGSHDELPANENDIKSLQYNEMMVAIERALEDLPQRCREVFILSRYQGMTTNEIAERLAISPRMVQKHLIKAFDHFRERLV